MLQTGFPRWSLLSSQNNSTENFFFFSSEFTKQHLSWECIYLVEEIECRSSKINPRFIPTFCYFLKLISTLDIFLKMFSTPANSWVWSTIISSEETANSSMFSAERYFPRLYFTPAKFFKRCYSKIFWRTFPFTYEASLSTNNGDKRENIPHLWTRNCFLGRSQKYFLTNLQYI